MRRNSTPSRRTVSGVTSWSARRSSSSWPCGDSSVSSRVIVPVAPGLAAACVGRPGHRLGRSNHAQGWAEPLRRAGQHRGGTPRTWRGTVDRPHQPRDRLHVFSAWQQAWRMWESPASSDARSGLPAHGGLGAGCAELVDWYGPQAVAAYDAAAAYGSECLRWCWRIGNMCVWRAIPMRGKRGGLCVGVAHAAR